MAQPPVDAALSAGPSRPLELTCNRQRHKYSETFGRVRPLHIRRLRSPAKTQLSDKPAIATGNPRVIGERPCHWHLHTVNFGHSSRLKSWVDSHGLTYPTTFDFRVTRAARRPTGSFPRRRCPPSTRRVWALAAAHSSPFDVHSGASFRPTRRGTVSLRRF